MAGQVDAHGLRRDLIFPDGFKGPPVGGVDKQDDDPDTHCGHQDRDEGGQADGHVARLDLKVRNPYKAL